MTWARAAARKTTVSRQKSQVSFFLEQQFPSMNILILLFLFRMAVRGHEHTSFTFAVLNGSSDRENNNFTFSVSNGSSRP